MAKSNKIYWKRFLIILGFVICMALLYWRCFYSVNYGDEVFCISSVWRFYKGDALLAEDWFPAQQLISWILSPLFALFRLFSKGNDGIILASRIAYVSFQGIVSIYLYCKLKKHPYTRIPAVLSYLLFTQNNMMTLNYNTLGIGCTLLVCVTLYTEEMYHKATLIVCGILIAIVVLSQPYTILLFFAWGISVVLTRIICNNRKVPELLNMRNYFWVGIGSFFVLVIFLIVVLSRAEMKEISTGIGYLLSDGEHQIDFAYKVKKFFERFFRYYKYQILVMGSCMIIGCFRESQMIKLMKTESFLLASGTAIGTLIYHGLISDYVPIDFIAVPFTFYGVSIAFLSKNKNKKLLLGWILPAFLYTFCVQLTTNTGILAVSSACIVSSVGGILMFENFLNSKEMSRYLKIAGGIVSVVLIIQIGLLFYHRMECVWWSVPVLECDTKIQEGPAKGLYTSAEDYQWYQEELRILDSLELGQEDTILYLDLAPHLYLYTDISAGTYSTWTIGEANFLQQYYEIYPERIPSVVCWMEETRLEDAKNAELFLRMGYEKLSIDKHVILKKSK